MEIIVACIMGLVQNNPDDQWQPKPGSIIPQISQINNIGQVSITFSDNMLFQNTANLANGTIRANNVTRPALEIKIFPYDLEKIIDFSWNCTKYTSTSMDLQLIFARPEIVTYQQSSRDQIQITFWGQNQFTSDPNSTQDTQLRRLSAQEYVEYGFNLTHEVPPQIEVSLGKLIASFGQVIQITGESFEIGVFVLNIFVSGSLQHLLSQVKKMQIVVHQILVNLPLPASVQIFYGYLLPIVAFDLIPTDSFYDDLLDLPKQQAINQSFKALGYESKYFIRNIGSIGIYLSLYPCIGLTSFAIGKLCRCKKAQQVNQRLKGALYWNGWFQLVADSFLTLTVSIMLNLILYSPDDFTSFGRAINFCIAAISAPAVLIHVGLVIYILNKKFDLIRRRHPITDKFSYLFSDLKIRANHENLTASLSGKQTTSYPIWSYLRILILGVTAVCLTDYPVVFLFLMNFTTLTSIIIVGTQAPFADKVKNSMDLFNEFTVLVINYHLMCFTNFVGDPDTRVYVGYSLILVTFLFLGINITFASLRMGQKPCTRVRYQYLRIKALKKRNEKNKKQATSSVQPVVGQGIQLEKIGLFRSQKDMSDKASQIDCRLSLNHSNQPVSQPEVQAVEAIKNDLQVVNLLDIDDVKFRNNFSIGTYKFNHANRSEYFVEPQTVQDIRSSYLGQPLAIKSDCNDNLIEAKTKKFKITQQLQSVVRVVPNEEVKSQIENVADLERQVGRVMTKVTPHYTPEIDDQPNMARPMQLEESKTENIISKPIGLKPKQLVQPEIKKKVIPGKPKKQFLSPYATNIIRAPSTKKKITYYHEKVNYAQPWVQAAQAVIAHQAAGVTIKAKLIAEKEKKQKAQQQ